MDEQRKTPGLPTSSNQNRLAGLDEHQLENVRRSVAMLSPGQMALSREEALSILRAYQGSQRELDQLRSPSPGA